MRHHILLFVDLNNQVLYFVLLPTAFSLSQVKLSLGTLMSL